MFNVIVIAGIILWLMYIFSFKGSRPPIQKEKTAEQKELLKKLLDMSGTFFSDRLLERILETQDLSCFTRCNLQVYSRDGDLLWEYLNIQNVSETPKHRFQATDLSALILSGHPETMTKFKLSLSEDESAYLTSSVGTRHACMLVSNAYVFPLTNFTVSTFNLELP